MRSSLCSLALVLAACRPGVDPGGAGQALRYTADAYDGIAYKVYVPSSYHAGTPVPLLLMLHGCLQNGDQFAAATNMNALAESQGFLAVYPSSSDPAQCWQWFSAADQARGSGEAGGLAGIVGKVQAGYSVDPARIYAAGFSAGAAMAVILGVAYPDLFAAIAVGSGLEYKAATSSAGAFGAMSGGGPDPAQQGRTAYHDMGAYARAVPAIVYYGTSDHTVNPLNGDQVLSQWAKTDDLASDGKEDGNINDTPDQTVPGQVPGGHSFTHYVYLDHATGAVALEKYRVDGMGHDWAGGASGGSYTDPQGPDASGLSWAFFQAHPQGGGGTPDLGGAPDLGAPDLGHPGPDLGGTPDLAHPPAPDLAPGGTVTLPSVAAEDGYAGALLADGHGATCQAGDKGLFNTDTYRALLSFDTTALPPGTPTGATLVLTRQSLSGPVTSLGLDLKHGFFGKSSAVGPEDYGDPATLIGIATFAAPAADGASVEVPLPASALSALNRGGRTQFRVRAQTTPGISPHVLVFHGGGDGASAPALIVTY